MLSGTGSTGVHWAVRLLAVGLLLAGLPMLLGGAYLISLGGSWYYLAAGLGLCAAGLLFWHGRKAGLHLYLVVLLLTIGWSVHEVGFAFWPSLPRLAAPLAVGAAALLVAPLLRGSEKPRSTLACLLGGGVLLCGFAAFLVGTARPHNVIRNDLPSAAGSVDPTTLAAGGDWPAYGRTGHGTRYAPAAQITPDNIGQLKVAWVARTGFIADQVQSLDDQNTPIHVDGTLFQCAPAGQITALDGVTGRIRWQFDPKAKSDDWKRCRSLAYFDPGPGDACGPRVIETTVDARLIAIKVRDGRPCESFGQQGTVNLWSGMGDANPEYLTNSSGPVVVNDRIIVGGRVVDNVTMGAPSGVIRAYSARTGALDWAWDLGQPALKGQPGPGQSYTPGTPNAWSLLSYDAGLGLVYLPLGNSSPDIYGGRRRPFDEAYSSALVALDVATGTERWKFQTVHHDLWDYDIPSQPVLADIPHGRPDGRGGHVPGVIMTTKRGQIFVLDRRTGVPIKAVIERKVPAGDGTIEGERYARTQPYSPQMAAVGTQPLREKMMWGATPIDQMLCRIQFRKLRYEGDFTTPSQHETLVFPGPLGGMNLGSTAVDERHGVMYFAEMRMPIVNHLIARDKVTPDMKYEGESGPFAPMAGTPYAMARRLFASPLGVPCLTPPWGTISGVDLASGKQLWQQPAGTSADLALGAFKPGFASYVGMPPMAGPIVTGGGIVWYAGSQDFYLRAFEARTGHMLWKGRLPTGSEATPMSYVGKDGRQYIVVSAGGARYNLGSQGDYIVAFALPR